MPLLDLDPDDLLSTTRAVRKRLDFARPVPDDLIRECVRLALQAPSGSNRITMRFVVVRDADLKAAAPRGCTTGSRSTPTAPTARRDTTRTASPTRPITSPSTCPRRRRW